MERLFYTNYIKKLRICQYLIAEKINSLRKDKKDFKINVDKEFLVSSELETVSQK